MDFLEQEIEHKYTKKNDDGTYTLHKIPSRHPEPERPLPETVSLTIFKWNKIRDIYFKFSTMLAADYQEDTTQGAWMMTDLEKHSYNKLLHKLINTRSDIVNNGFFKKVDGKKEIDMAERHFTHPLFRRYLNAQDAYNEFASELNADIAVRKVNSEEAYKQGLLFRFMVDIFVIVTGEYLCGKFVCYTQEDIENNPYWNDQVSLISELFLVCIQAFVEQTKDDKKKFEAAFIEASELIALVAKDLEKESQTTTSTAETTSSGSSQTSTPDDLSALNIPGPSET